MSRTALFRVRGPHGKRYSSLWVNQYGGRWRWHANTEWHRDVPRCWANNAGWTRTRIGAHLRGRIGWLALEARRIRAAFDERQA